jgi:hypothetical protein
VGETVLLRVVVPLGVVEAEDVPDGLKPTERDTVPVTEIDGDELALFDSDGEDVAVIDDVEVPLDV